jgi:hypothetical protein
MSGKLLPLDFDKTLTPRGSSKACPLAPLQWSEVKLSSSQLCFRLLN